MDINDFKDNYKFKLIIPIIYVINWVLMLVGPFFFQVTYHYICVFTLLYLSYKVAQALICAIISFVKSWKILNKFERNQQASSSAEMDYEIIHEDHERIVYGFIIPNYKEDVELLQETLDQLAKQKRAKQFYAIFMGMQLHQQNSHLKGEYFKKRYADKFLTIQYTQHEMRQYEQKGKASNVSWCAEHLEPFLEKANIRQEELFLTIIDADTWVPEAYINEVEEHILSNYENRNTFIYQPPQAYTRNQLDVPIFVRVFDNLHGMYHYNNLLSVMNTSFPLSNYSLSYQLVKRIGYWDTCPDAIGEDFHTTIKAFFKTHGQIEAVPIFTLMNQVNISTGRGYFKDIEARFWQAERHARGVCDVAYSIQMFRRTPFSLKTLNVTFQVIELFALAAIVPWTFIAMNYQSHILFKYQKPSPYLISEDKLGYLWNFLGVATFLAYALYYIIRHRSTKLFYGLENESILRIVESPLLLVVNMAILSVPAFVISHFGVLFEGSEYVVADKVISRKQIEQ